MARQAPDQWGRIDHAEPFAYLSGGCLKSWRLCGMALGLSIERACMHAKRTGGSGIFGRSEETRSDGLGCYLAGAPRQPGGLAVLEARREGRVQDPTGSPRSFRLNPFRSGLGLRIGGRSNVLDQDTAHGRTGTAYRDCGSVQSKLYRVERSAPETSIEVMRHRQRTLSLVTHVGVHM